MCVCMLCSLLGLSHTRILLKTAILSWPQNDGSREFSVDQFKGKQLSPMFRPDAHLALKATRASG